MYFSRVKTKPDINKLSQISHIIRENTYGIHQLLRDIFKNEKERDFLYREEIANEQLSYYSGAKGEPIYYVVSQNKPAKTNGLFDIVTKVYEPKISAGDKLAFILRANPTIARKEEGKKHSTRHDVVMDAQYQLLSGLMHELNIDHKDRKRAVKKEVLARWNENTNSDITEKLRVIVGKSDLYKEKLGTKFTNAELLETALKAAVDTALNKWIDAKSEKSGFEVMCDKNQGRRKIQATGYRWNALPRKGKTAGFSTVDFSGEIKVTSESAFMEALFTGIGPAKGFGCGLMLVRRN